MRLTGLFSLPHIYLYKKNIILLNQRVLSRTLTEYCIKNNYTKINNQYELIDKIGENNLDDYNFYIFCINPYKRMISIFPGILLLRPAFKKNFINNKFLMDLMDNEEKKVFKDNLKSNNLNNFKLCLQIFIKYFDKYYNHHTKYELNDNILNLNFDGHLSCQTDSIVYSEDILKRCNIIKVEELNSIENKKILKILFNTEVLENKTKTNYPLNKNEYLIEEYIALINKYYKKDIDFFNYEIK